MTAETKTELRTILSKAGGQFDLGEIKPEFFLGVGKASVTQVSYCDGPFPHSKNVIVNARGDWFMQVVTGHN